MTSILTFKIEDGEKIIIVSDRQHTFDKTTSESKKIFLFNDFLYCGSGFDSIINSIKTEVKDYTNLDACANKIKDLIKEKHDAYAKTGLVNISSSEVGDTEILLLNFKTLEGFYIQGLEKQELKQVEILGNCHSEEGKIIDEYQKDFQTTLAVQEELFKKIFKTFSDLGKNNPLTGHPALFQLDIYVLEKNKETINFKINYLEDISDFAKYEVKEDEQKN